jgi:hypothetical protein
VLDVRPKDAHQALTIAEDHAAAAKHAPEQEHGLGNYVSPVINEQLPHQCLESIDIGAHDVKATSPKVRCADVDTEATC